MILINRPTLSAAVILLILIGCDDRAVYIAREAADRQAGQNESMARLQQEVAQGSRRLVEEDAAARSQALQVHQDLQAERSQLTSGWNDLEAERRAIAGSRRSESLLATVLKGAAASAIAILTLAYAYLALYGACRDHNGATAIRELLVDQFVVEPPRLIDVGVDRKRSSTAPKASGLALSRPSGEVSNHGAEQSRMVM